MWLILLLLLLHSRRAIWERMTHNVEPNWFMIAVECRVFWSDSREPNTCCLILSRGCVSSYHSCHRVVLLAQMQRFYCASYTYGYQWRITLQTINHKVYFAQTKYSYIHLYLHKRRRKGKLSTVIKMFQSLTVFADRELESSKLTVLWTKKALSRTSVIFVRGTL